jgi:hypothetical protein
MKFHNTAGAYPDDRYDLILRLEEGGNPHLTPYNDGAGWVTRIKGVVFALFLQTALLGY